MFKKILLYLLLFGATSLMSSCFDVVEEVDLKSNGSGKIKAIVNLSKSKTKVASLMKLDKIDAVKIPTEQEIRTQASKINTILKNTKGISNVQYSLDFNNYIGTISCDFADIDALNTFTKALSAQFKTALSDYSTYAYDKNTKTLTRTYKYNNQGQKELKKLKPENQQSLQDAYYTYIYRFDSTIKSQKNATAKVSPNKKAVLLKVNVVDIVNGKVNLSNTITLN